MWLDNSKIVYVVQKSITTSRRRNPHNDLIALKR